MKPDWYNNSPDEQKRQVDFDDVFESEERLHNMLVSQVVRLDKKTDKHQEYTYEEISSILDKISSLEKEVEILQKKSLISVIKDSFNKWFFGTKG